MKTKTQVLVTKLHLMLSKFFNQISSGQDVVLYITGEYLAKAYDNDSYMHINTADLGQLITALEDRNIVVDVMSHQVTSYKLKCTYNRDVVFTSIDRMEDRIINTGGR